MVLETDITENMIKVDKCVRKNWSVLNVSEGAPKGPVSYTASGSRGWDNPLQNLW